MLIGGREAKHLDAVHEHQRDGGVLHELRVQVPAVREAEEAAVPGVHGDRQELEA